LTVTDDPPEQKLYTAAEVLDIVLAAYERGLQCAAAEATRARLNSADYAAALRAARAETEARWMKATAANTYAERGYPVGYDYKGGPVDFDTGLPEGSGCAWLRRTRKRRQVAA
jgi:hypothetical protein